VFSFNRAYDFIREVAQMRMPINRGFPLIPAAARQKPWFEIPRGAGSTVYRVSAFARSISSGWPGRVGRTIRDGSSETAFLSPVTVPGDVANRYTLLDEFPIMGEGRQIHFDDDDREGSSRRSVPFAVFGHYEIDEVDVRVPDRPLIRGRPPAPFLIPLNRIGPGDAEIVLHELHPEHIDLLSLSVALTENPVTLLLRFYDGTYAQGKQKFQEVAVTAPESDSIGALHIEVLNRHPMRGPGRISAMIAADDTVNQNASALIYGLVHR
jgi:hypothetical protein